MPESISHINLKNDFPKIHEIYEVVINEYASTLRGINQASNKLHLGTALILLKSIYNHLTSLELLLENCYIESSGAIASSLWEKSITLQYLLLDLEKRIPVYVTHNTFKSTPWTIKKMATDIVKHEPLPKGKKIEDSFDLLYLQYSYLCAIKHGNPYTSTYLNKIQEGENIFEPKPIISIIDKDIVGLLYMYSITTVYDGIREFSKAFCQSDIYKRLKNIDRNITTAVTQLDLKPPPIIMTSANDFRPEFWDLLKGLNK